MTHAVQRFLTELLPPGSNVTLESDGIATATLGPEWLIAAWDDARGDHTVTVAAYTLPGGRCLHLWTGPSDAPHKASESLRASGLPVLRVEAPTPPTVAVELTESVGDTLDLFSV